jgi:hypothetical protein
VIRTTLGRLRQSRFPQVLGLQSNDIPQICAFANQAIQQLVNEGGETGFVGGWMRMVFQVSKCSPYITMPREVQRAVGIDVCRFPIRIQNEFYEFLEAGVGLARGGDGTVNSLTKASCWGGALEGYDRGFFPSMRDLDPTNQYLQVYLTDPRDVGSRILFGPATDQNGNPIYTTDGANQVNGFYVQLQQPFATSPFIVSGFSGVQKDITYGDVLVYQIDATSGNMILLSRYGPQERTPSYRRYYINNLPASCCNTPVPSNPCVPPVTPPMAQVTAMVKLEFIPVSVDTDFLLIGNIPALIEEAKAIRYGDIDSAEATQLSIKSHLKAVKLLNDELSAYLGKQNIAVNVAPWGTARLSRPMSAVRWG